MSSSGWIDWVTHWLSDICAGQDRPISSLLHASSPFQLLCFMWLPPSRISAGCLLTHLFLGDSTLQSGSSWNKTQPSTCNMLWDVRPVSCPEGWQPWQGDVTCLNGSYWAMPFSFRFYFAYEKIISITRKGVGYLFNYECLLAVHLGNANEHLCCLVWTDYWPWRNYWCCSWMKLSLTF